MAFTEEVSRTPTAIEDISIELFSPNPAGEGGAGDRGEGG